MYVGGSSKDNTLSMNSNYVALPHTHTYCHETIYYLCSQFKRKGKRVCTINVYLYTNYCRTLIHDSLFMILGISGRCFTPLYCQAFGVPEQVNYTVCGNKLLIRRVLLCLNNVSVTASTKPLFVCTGDYFT